MQTVNSSLNKAVRWTAMLWVTSLMGVSCVPGQMAGEPSVDPPVNTLTPRQEAEGWELLFDGDNPATHWRNYNQEELSDGWQVIEGGWLARVEDRAGDIITRETFDDFELFLEWKVDNRSNSGIFYMVQELEGRPIWHSAPEYQILDNRPNQSPQTAAGSLFDLIGSSAWNEAARPAGEINTARIVKRGDYVEHHMNGRLLFTFNMNTDEWHEKVEQSKFNAPPFATAPKGHIGLQDHGDWVAFRNIRIRRLGE